MQVPPQFRPDVLQQQATRRANIARALNNPMLLPGTKDKLEKDLAGIDEQLKAANDFWGRRGQVPDAVKEALGLGLGTDVAAVAGVKKGKELQATEGHKMTDNVLAGGRAYDTDMKPLFSVAKGIVNDPSFYSGFGGNLDLLKNRLIAAMGMNPNAPKAQEMLQKITAMGTLATINQQKYDVSAAGDTAGRIFAQQVDLVSKTVPGLENSVAGNMALIEINDRLGAFRSKMAELAREELAAQRAGKRGRELQLDPRLVPDQFDAKVTAYLKANPIFTEQEARNPQLLGAPVFRSRAEAEARLPPGKHLPYKGPNWKPGDKYYVRP